jgi:hypothetical protein
MAWQSPLSVVYLFAVLSVWCHRGTLLFSLHAGLGSSSSHVVLEARVRGEVLGCGVPGSRSIALHRGKPSKSQRLEVKAHRGLVVRGSCLYPGCQTDRQQHQANITGREGEDHDGKIGRWRKQTSPSPAITSNIKSTATVLIGVQLSKGPSPRAMCGWVRKSVRRARTSEL